MTEKQAIEELLFQSCRHTDIENPRWINGFLGILRPFQGKLIESNFHKIITAIDILYDKLNDSQIKNEIIASIWGICHLGRTWALNPEGMLQSNKLINSEQISQINNWIDHISYITFCILDGCEKEVAFEFYNQEYLDEK